MYKSMQVQTTYRWKSLAHNRGHIHATYNGFLLNSKNTCSATSSTLTVNYRQPSGSDQPHHRSLALRFILFGNANTLAEPFASNSPRHRSFGSTVYTVWPWMFTYTHWHATVDKQQTSQTLCCALRLWRRECASTKRLKHGTLLFAPLGRPAPRSQKCSTQCIVKRVCS